jgi:hypothetical protein
LTLKSQEIGPISERLAVVSDDGIPFGRVLSIRLVGKQMKSLEGMKGRFSNPIRSDKIRWTAKQQVWKGMTRKDASLWFFGSPLQGISALIGNIERWWCCDWFSDLPNGANLGAVAKAFQAGPRSDREMRLQKTPVLNGMEGLPAARLKGADTNSNGLGTDSGEKARGQPGQKEEH